MGPVDAVPVFFGMRQFAQPKLKPSAACPTEGSGRPAAWNPKALLSVAERRTTRTEVAMYVRIIAEFGQEGTPRRAALVDERQQHYQQHGTYRQGRSFPWGKKQGPEPQLLI